MSLVYLENQQYDQAKHLLLQALEISQRIGSSRSEAQALNKLAHLHLAQQLYGEAEAEFRALLTTVADLGDPVGTTYAHLGLGLVHLARDEWVSADRALRAARVVADTTGDRISLGRVLLAQAETAWQADDHGLMAELLMQAKEVFTAAEAAHWLEQVSALERRSQTAQ
jgi:tetratricopeptide (TPR) repeat protein